MYGRRPRHLRLTLYIEAHLHLSRRNTQGRSQWCNYQIPVVVSHRYQHREPRGDPKPYPSISLSVVLTSHWQREFEQPFSEKYWSCDVIFSLKSHRSTISETLCSVETVNGKICRRCPCTFLSRWLTGTKGLPPGPKTRHSDDRPLRVHHRRWYGPCRVRDTYVVGVLSGPRIQETLLSRTSDYPLYLWIWPNFWAVLSTTLCLTVLVPTS